jgi:16S rRNA (uracil1498-N3)-methyltransferase
MPKYDQKNPGERFFVRPDDVHGALLELRGDEAKHAQKVLRRKKGQAIICVDGVGIEYHGIIDGFRDKRVQVTIAKTLRRQREPYLEVRLIQAVAKDSRFRQVVEKSVELGVQSIVPVETKRTKPGDWGKHVGRWQKVAVVAMKQCGRTRLPEVLPCADIADALNAVDAQRKFIAHPDWEQDGPVPSLLKAAGSLDAVKSAALAIGPEGGFTDEEVAAAVECGFVPVHLGERRLRSETAAIASLTLLMGHAGEL